MKLTPILCVFLLLICAGCGFEDREKSLNAREEQLSQKRQELLLWEQRLTIRERDLDARKLMLDSNDKTIDTAMGNNAAVIGKWVIKMQCTETSCDGSAIGDSITEHWEVTSNDNQVVAKVYAGQKLSRIYNGFYRQNTLVLVDDKSPTESLIRIVLRVTPGSSMEGTREIVQKNCKIVYSLTAKRL